MANPTRRPRRTTLPDLGGSFARLRARWARQGRLVRQLSTKADIMAKPRGTAPVRRMGRQAASLEAVREAVGYHKAWSRWSATNDELASLVDEILHYPAATFTDLSVRFEALTWLLLADGAVVDHHAVRQVRRFGRALRALAGEKMRANRGRN